MKALKLRDNMKCLDSSTQSLIIFIFVCTYVIFLSHIWEEEVVSLLIKYEIPVLNAKMDEQELYM